MEHSAPVDESIPGLSNEESRLETFSTYPEPHNLNIKDLVKSGFFYTNSSTSVHCIGCGSEVKAWHEGDNPSDPKFHEINCPFVTSNQSQSLVALTETVTNSSSSLKATVHSNIELTKPLETVATNTQEMMAPQQEGSIPFATANFPLNEQKKINNPRNQQGYHKSLPLQRPLTMFDPSHQVQTEISTVFQRQGSHTPSTPSRQSSFLSISEHVQIPSEPSSISRQLCATTAILSARSDDLVPLTNNNDTFFSRIENPDDYEEFINKLNLRNAEHRLQTFSHYWDETIVFRNVRLLAKYGFYSQGQGDAVECFCCHVIVANWERNDDPKSRHYEMSPQCRFINGEECGDVPLPPERRSARSLTPSPVHTARYISPLPTPSHNVPPQSPMQSIGRSSNSSHHSSPHQSLVHQSASNAPMTMTQQRQPVAQATPEDQGASGESYHLSTLIERSNLYDVFPCANPNNRAMREERARLQSLNNSSFRQNTRLRASNETVAQAGFYYFRSGDKVKCFYCGGGLMDFLEGDDPWTEHAKYYPECEYLLQQKGPAWINRISVQNPFTNRPQLPTSSPTRVLPNVVSSSRSPAPSTSRIADPQERLQRREELVDESMRTLQAQSARNMGFTDDRIRQVMMDKINRSDCYYQSSESLINALINGGDEDVPPDEEQRGNTIDMSGQVVHIRGGEFVGPAIINGRVVQGRQRSRAGGRSQISINGQPLDEFIAERFDHPFFNDPTGYQNRTVVRNREPPPAPPTFPPTPVSSIREAVNAAGSSNAEQRLEEIERERRCKICLNHIADILFEPCGHICACSACSNLVNECPICRRRITRFVRTYHA